MAEPIKIGLLGLGTVGAGVLSALQGQGEVLSRAAGRSLLVTKVAVRDLKKPRDCDVLDVSLMTDPKALAADPDIDLLVEVMGGTTFAKECIEIALQSGKPVVTANKALIAEHGDALLAMAQDAGVPLVFEASVCAGIPIIKVLNEGLSANRIESIVGIINGTTNFILTRMKTSGCSYQEALDEATSRGYVEADPRLDLDGIDAAHKLTILVRMAFGTSCAIEEVYQEGIGNVSEIDFPLASSLGYDIKPVAIARRRDNGIECRVHLAIVEKDSLLAHVNGVMNALMVKSDALGTSLYYGAGAGASATASAVLADIIDVIKGRPCSSGRSAEPGLSVLPIEETRSGYYLRAQMHDEPGILAEVSQLFTEAGLSIETMLQTPVEGTEPREVYMAFVTHEADEKSFLDLLARIKAHPGNLSVNFLRRIERCETAA